MVEIVEVKTKRQQRDFINLPIRLYKDCPYFVPELYCDAKYIFSKKCIYLEQCEQVFFNAYKDGKIVGRIQGILQKAANEKWNQKRVRFIRFDCINDIEVSNALFDALSKYAKTKNMNELVGPLGYNDLEREGLLIEGFNEYSTFEEQYNYEYYQKLIENYGFKKEVDWVESKIYLPDEENTRLSKVSKMVARLNNVHLSKCKTSNEFINKYGDAFFKILDETYDKIYGTVPFTEKIKNKTLKAFKLIIDVKYVAVILNEKEEVIGFGICFPSIAKAVRECNGHLTPIGLIKIFHSIKHPSIIDLGLVGVKEEYRKTGINALILAETMNILKKPNILYAETNLNLEDNSAVTGQWKEFKEVRHKRRRSFIKTI